MAIIHPSLALEFLEPASAGGGINAKAQTPRQAEAYGISRLRSDIGVADRSLLIFRPELQFVRNVIDAMACTGHSIHS
jgi:hypothetical protein